MTALYTAANNCMRGTFETQEVCVSFAAQMEADAVRVSLTLIDGVLDLPHIKQIITMVQQRINAFLDYIVEYELVTITIPRLDTLTDRLTIPGLGVRGMTLTDALEIAAQVGCSHLVPTPPKP